MVDEDEKIAKTSVVILRTIAQGFLYRVFWNHIVYTNLERQDDEVGSVICTSFWKMYSPFDLEKGMNTLCQESLSLYDMMY